MIIGFVIESFTIRGSGVAQYDYAHYNEIILKNKSIIFSPGFKGDELAFRKFAVRFPIVFYNCLKESVETNNIDVLYVISYGRKQDSSKYTNLGKCKTVIHCVFDLSEPHGDVYAAVSKTLALKYNWDKYVNHMISHYPSKTKKNLRDKLAIPESAKVFGRYGGRDTFNLTWSFDVIKQLLEKSDDVYFLFMNTPVFYTHPRIFYFEPTVDIDEKNEFIMTCDAHIVFETLGHTFGLVCGEFGVNNKPSIIYNGDVWNRAHIDIQGENGIYFQTPQELWEILVNFEKKEYNISCYDYYTPENIMEEFKNIFLK
jgi:hypothetical protein